MRILVVDDEPALIESYRHVLAPKHSESSDALGALASALFDDAPAVQELHPAMEVTYCRQGADAVRAVEAALANGQAFQVAFIDVRMPPGIDGKETARQIRVLDPHVNLVIVSGYSDHNVTDIALAAGPPDKIFYLSKPFNAAEIQQMATALARRWETDARQIQLLRQKMQELEESEARARHAAHHDFLTGAPNRLALQHALNAKLSGDRSGLALVLLDLDRFKQVNDAFGHAAGDHLLQTIYQGLREEVPPGTMVARLGGDEFAFMLECETVEAAEEVCRRVVSRCSQAYIVYGDGVQVGASAGLLWTEDYPDSDSGDLLRFADIALYEAKRAGRGQCCRFDAAMDVSTHFRRTIEGALCHAIFNDELELFYQPIVERDSLATVGFEALLRWHSPIHGEVPPAVFIPIAEESGLIHSLGDWVLDRALKDSLNWPNFFVSINFSARQFKRPDFTEVVCDAANKARVPYHRVQIEVTESAMFDDIERATATLAELQSRGFRIALDDFGTGYCNLLNLKNFALDCIKIDKSFVEGLGMEAHAAAIVGSIAQLARGLGLTVIAEGVETSMQCQALRVMGCSHMQGFLFGKAAPLSISNACYDAAQVGADSMRVKDTEQQAVG